MLWEEIPNIITLLKCMPEDLWEKIDEDDPHPEHRWDACVETKDELMVSHKGYVVLPFDNNHI
jgi:hypothetical protein